MATTLSALRGDTFSYTAAIKQVDGSTAYNLAGCTLWWTLKRAFSESDDDAICKLYWVSGGASSGITVASPANGQATVKLTPSQTDALVPDAVYYWDLQLLDGAGDVYTVSDGYLDVDADTTRRRTTP